MEDLVKLFVDNGISIVCVAYLMYFQSTTMKEMLSALTSINNRLSIIETTLSVGRKNNDDNKEGA